MSNFKDIYLAELEDTLSNKTKPDWIQEKLKIFSVEEKQVLHLVFEKLNFSDFLLILPMIVCLKKQGIMDVKND